MRIDAVTIFPEMFAALTESGVTRRALEDGIWSLGFQNPRDYVTSNYRTVDDRPYGGGPGMVMRPEPWGEALDAVLPMHVDPLLVIPTPSGRPFTQSMAGQWAARPGLVIACGRYEGIDARVAEDYAQRIEVAPISIGDYVLAGGEVAALAIVEAVTRLLPGVVGNEESITDDSFAPGAMESLVEGPVYTRPPEWRGHPVPDVLLSGDHARIAEWRRAQAERRTADVRPDLLEG